MLRPAGLLFGYPAREETHELVMAGEGIAELLAHGFTANAWAKRLGQKAAATAS